MIGYVTTHEDESSQPGAQEMGQQSVHDCSRIYGAISIALVLLM